MTSATEIGGDNPRTPFARRFVGAMKLDARVFSEVEDDRAALLQASAVVLVGGLARGVGAVGEEGLVGIVGSTLAGVVIWLAAAALIWAIGVRRFEYTSSYPELLRTLGFAAAPLLWLCLCALPMGSVATVVWAVVHTWSILALVVAAREALDVSTQQALVVCVLSLLAAFALLFLLGILFVGRGVSS